MTETDRINRARARARDHGLYFCVVCDQPIRGKTYYNKGAACHFGCGGGNLGELHEMEELQPCQEMALKNVREATKSLHDAALPRLRQRMTHLGFQPGDVDKTLEWIRDRAPIIIHVDLAAFGKKLAGDTHYRNQFETGTSRGNLCHETRMRWEADLFDGAYVDAPPKHCCKYGVLNVTNDPQGVRTCRSYGTSYFLLRNVRLRTTFAANDSGGINIEDIATVDYYAHVLEKYSDVELKAAVEVATGVAFGRDSEAIMNYKEAQIHGDVCLAENVELIMLHPSLRTERHSEMLRQLSSRCKAPLVWMEGVDDEGMFKGEASDEDIDESFSSPAPAPVSHDGFDDAELRKALEASRSSALDLRTPVTATVSHDGFEENDLLKAIEASRRSASEDNFLIDASEESALEFALELSKSVHEDSPSSLCTTCENGCGRLRAEGYKSCCRTCTQSCGARHGPTCDEAAAIQASMTSNCKMGCGRPAVQGLELCARCKEEDDLIAQAIKASMETSAPICKNGCRRALVDGSDLCRECHEEDWELERALHASRQEDTDCQRKCQNDEGRDVAVDDCRSINDVAASLEESPAVEMDDEACGEDVDKGSQKTYVLKARLDNDTRRFQVSWSRNASAGDMLQVLSEAVRHVFGLPISSKLILTYKDDGDGEMLTLAEPTVKDFMDAQSGSLRIFVSVEETAVLSESMPDPEVIKLEETTVLRETVPDPQVSMVEDVIAIPSKNPESVHLVESPSEDQETKREQDHFIGYDLSSWDDFEHVQDPLEEWYDNATIVKPAENHSDHEISDDLENKTPKLGCSDTHGQL